MVGEGVGGVGEISAARTADVAASTCKYIKCLESTLGRQIKDRHTPRNERLVMESDNLVRY